MKEELLVMALCLTYNHEKYLEDALKGFVMQQTDFRFVAVVIDDASTDKTADVLRQYEKQYPDIIKAVYLTENHYSQKKPKLPYYKQWQDEAKYIAICEGDDYWTNPMKLQKQVDFLEKHTDYSMCFHAANVSIEGVDPSQKGAKCELIEEREYNSTELFEQWIVPTASILYRRDIVCSFQISHSEWLTRGDIALVLQCSHTGRVWGMSERMSVYRMQPNSVSHNPLYRGTEYMRLPMHFLCIYHNFPKVSRKPVKWNISHAYYCRMKYGKGIFNKVRDFFLFIYWDPQSAFRKISRILS